MPSAWLPCAAHVVDNIIAGSVYVYPLSFLDMIVLKGNLDSTITAGVLRVCCWYHYPSVIWDVWVAFLESSFLLALWHIDIYDAIAQRHQTGLIRGYICTCRLDALHSTESADWFVQT